jgi:hypothetical protein
MSSEPVNNQRRRAVWSALSDLWIDSEIQDHEMDYLAQILVDSGYTLAELENIYRYEVSTVVWTNLSPLNSGEKVWSGFDQEWLGNEIVKNLEREEKDPLYRFYIRSWIGQWIRTRSVHNKWLKLMAKVREKRGH